MGRMRKRFNEKARMSSERGTEIKNEIEENVQVEFEVKEDQYDQSNPLILSKKKKVAKPNKNAAAIPVKKLSKKQRKKLQSVIERKKKKANRAELLEKLQKVQAMPEDLQHLTSTADMQTYGLKRVSEDSINVSSRSTKISNIKRSKKDRYLPPSKKVKLSSNVVDFELTSSDSDESDDIEPDKEESTEQSSDIPFKDKNLKFVETEKVELPIQVEETNSSCMKESPRNNEVSSPTVDLKLSDKGVKKSSAPAVFLPVHRLPEIQSAREKLPIFYEEQSIIEAIKEHPVVVIHGETGSGKTTQVPQFLYEAGFTQNKKMIGITEPRRIAAMTMAARVGEELNSPELVSYHIRYKKTVDEKTEIKFMTDGVLLKEMRHDFLLSKYSVIIIDEAHERSVFSDVLIGLLSRIAPLRQKKGDPLKLVIMSATMRVQDFMENKRLFKREPFLIRLDSRQYKVVAHFKKHTPEDYLEAAYQKVCEIHSKEPAGAILVFLTGEKEVTRLCKMLREAFPFPNQDQYEEKEKPPTTPRLDPKPKKKKRHVVDSFCSLPEKINLDDFSAEPLDTENMQHQYSDDEETAHGETIQRSPVKSFSSAGPLYALRLFSVLPFEEQEKVFKPPPAGSRLCVVSTNVAETSITIPGLKYVVDSGKMKTKVYDKLVGGISRFAITWCSKASANQRAGRAGRTKDGHCYRLYSSAVFEHDFPDFSPPEIQRIPVDDVLLQMKAMGIDRVVNFPFPAPPDTEGLKAAERRLVLLGALQDLQKGDRYKEVAKWEYSAKVTPLGRAMSRFPLSPRYAKMLLLSYKHNCIPYVIAIVSALTVPEIFLCFQNEDVDIQNEDTKVEETETSPEETKSQWTGIKKIGAGKGKSLLLGDVMVLLRTVAFFIDSKNKYNFCQRNGIRHKAMVEVYKMCCQLCREMNRAFQDISLPKDFRLDKPTEEIIEKIRKIVTTGFTDHVARRVPVEDSKIDKSLKNAYRCLDLEEAVFIHPSSILFSELPEYVVYQEISHTSKYYMKGVVAIEPEWLPCFAAASCHFSVPESEDPPPAYNAEKDAIICGVKSTFGTWQWELPSVKMDMPRSLARYSWFCFFLLDGAVFKFFKTYKSQLLSHPSYMLKSWAKLVPRVRFLLQAVITKEIDSKCALKEAWKKDKKYLLREFLEWLPEDKHLEVECSWPPST
ncbi:probable ATP-dependent RNA helicase DHX37 [Uloborus diversus]|uniref:probable ATP-dependent RNA helicase DHX37 n=1 Tax=Uloborus diversus TaxID=327109 RepID=UPI0024098E38|nr:probable ATP-dependent RNA helicase DHX37 [Uloborus diversus]